MPLKLRIASRWISLSFCLDVLHVPCHATINIFYNVKVSLFYSILGKLVRDFIQTVRVLSEAICSLIMLALYDILLDNFFTLTIADAAESVEM